MIVPQAAFENLVLRGVVVSLWVSELRDLIEANGGKYDGRMVPNFTSILEALTMRNAEFLRQIAQVPSNHLPTKGDIKALRDLYLDT